MTYKNVNPKRLKYLLTFGCDPAELRAFLTKTQKRLITAGEKVQNLPYGLDKQVSFVVRLGSRAFPIFQEWFREHLHAVDVVPVAEIVSRFQAFENGTSKPLEEEEQRLSRSALIHLASEETSLELLTFLESPMPGEEAQVHERDVNSPTSVDVRELRQAHLPSANELRMIAAAILRSQDLNDSNNLDGSDLESYVRALVCVKEQDQEGYTEIEARLAEEGIYRNVLEEALSELRPIGYQGFTESPIAEVTDASTIDVQQVEVVAHCFNVTAQGIAFLKPILLLDRGELWAAPEGMIMEIFPTTGELIAFPNKRGVRVPERGEIGIWFIEPYETDKSVRTRIRKGGRPIFEVIAIPVVSSEHDRVREIIKSDQYARYNKVVFETTDNLLIRSRKDFHEAIREGLKEPFDAWTAHAGFIWQSRRFVIGPMAPPNFPYDCSEIEFVLQRLLGLEEEIDGLPKLTKKNVRDLVAAFRKLHHEIDANRAESLGWNLERYLTSEGTLSQVAQLLLGNAKIKREVDKAIADRVDRALTSKKDLKNEITRLEERRALLEKAIKQREADQMKTPSQVSKAVREAFDRAKTQGAEMLGSVAVFEHFMRASVQSTGPLRGGPVDDFLGPQPVWKRCDSNPANIENILVVHGVPVDRAGAIARTIEITAKAGLILILTGVAANPVAENVARALSAKAVLITTVGIGMLGVENISPQLHELGDTADGLVLKAANHSDIECYAAELLEYVLGRIAVGGGEPPKIIFTLSDGPSSLPLSSTIEQVSVLIDLDVDSAIEINEGASDLMEFVEDEERRRGKRVWRPALKRLTAAYRELPTDYRSTVASLIRKGFVERVLRGAGD